MPNAGSFRHAWHRSQHIWTGKAGWAAGIIVVGYVYDRQFQASAMTRTTRAFWDVAVISADYKINFRAERGIEHLNSIHERAAKRLLACCRENGGLFIKFGQSLAVQSALLPPPFRRELSSLYDNAPSAPVSHIAPVIERCFPGQTIDDLFTDFSSEAVASASVAQVHTARLRSNPDQVVAVKIQKPEIRKQIGWDLFALRSCSQMIELVFDIPIMWSVREIEQRLREELDFEREGNNSELAQKDLTNLGDRWMKRSVYIPKVFWDATRKEVLTTEWIDGTSLVHPTQLAHEGWSNKDVMQRMASLFAFQIFVTGNVHGDPHPGNILVRQNPLNLNTKEPQLVLLDHGLYVRESNTFRRQYAEFWRAAMIGDNKAMKRIATSWGMPDETMFSTMVSLKAPQLGNMHAKRSTGDTKGSSKDYNDGSKGTHFDQQMEMKARAVAALRDSLKLPPELVFVTRNMNIVRANNQSLGTPVNRVQILGHYAARGLRMMLLHEATSSARRYDHIHGVAPRRDTLFSRIASVVSAEWSYATFCIALWVAGAGMAVYDLCGRLRALVSGRTYSRNSENVFDEAMRRTLENRLGYQIDTSLFNA
ncbi:ABC1-domain-containing protein [Coemansia reversa NRRL 1564]|uniref:ABC1-domain-containing protein n=1 Tax=Coemansia reversa (strain ATCC 12441 / NRRL 1564) TaxID=763665 RepID=A0A2G5BII3_COERN|nr:ABC1-domain-containing protein [Coemansia reversa NRRL 1564]|eukprot:PIA18816.1 ABC1-domain-containing protein [Coemansia reversa NRRL 1564]